ncbi:MAG: DMT family transporter [Candidatus Puniceispirillales bacterium]
MTAGGDHPDQQVTGRDIFFGAACLFGEIVLSFGIASLVKLLEPSLSIFLILFFRYLFCLPLLLFHGWRQRGTDLFQINNRRVLVLRTISGFMGLLTWFAAVALIDLSLATALFQMLPIFITILAPMLLGEIVGRRRLMAVIIGFVGVALLLEPVSFEGLGWGLAAGLAAPFFAALMFIFLRKLGPTEAAVSTALWYNMAGVVLAGMLSLSDGSMQDFIRSPIDDGWWMMLAGIGVLASFQQMMMALSHRFAPASVLAPVHYTAIPVGVATGIIFFGESLTLEFVAGVAIILSANYYILVRERMQAQGHH